MPIGAEVFFRAEEDISERVIFPVLPSQSNGIEDARFVEFDEGWEEYLLRYLYRLHRAEHPLRIARDRMTF